MPSDDRVALATEAVAGPAEAFRSALATTVEQVRALLAANAPSRNGQIERSAAELGRFAMGRIDAVRFVALLAGGEHLSAQAAEHIQRAMTVLTGLMAEGDRLFHLEVEPGHDLRDAVARAIGRLGAAFGAARVVALARSERYDAEHVSLLESLGFERWTTAERAVAPPLVVTVRGDDVRPVGLADFLDGTQKIVLVVSGECPPAALVRLVSPGTFVAQTADRSGLDRLAAWGGPGIAALVPESAARFIHDPAGGVTLGERLTVEFVPDERPRKPRGGLSAVQQADDLAQLVSLRELAAAAPAAPMSGAEAAPAAADPADRLAAWLLSQADLNGPT